MADATRLGRATAHRWCATARRWRAGAAAAVLALAGSGLAGEAVVEIDAVLAIEADMDAPPPEAAAWQPRRLPDRWQERGAPRAGTVWYAVELPASPPSSAPQALWLPKVSMHAALWVDGRPVRPLGASAQPRARHWNTPLLFELPPGEAGAPARRVQLQVKAEPGHDGGLAPLRAGPASALQSRHASLGFWRRTAVAASIAFGLSIGLVFVLVWLRQRDQPAWGYFGSGAALWSVSNLNFVVQDVPLADRAWELAVHLTTFWALLLMSLFALSLTNRLPRRLERGAWAYALLGAAGLWAAGDRGLSTPTAALMLPVLAFGGWSMATVVGWVRRRTSTDHLLFAAVAALTLGAAGHDWLIKAGHLAYAQPYLLPFVAPLLLGLLAWILAGDYAHTRVELAHANRSLDARLRAREEELQQAFARQAQAEREAAAAQERARILRDMHDGAGAHLSTALRQIERGTATSAQLAATLRDALDQLKLSIDALNLPPGDVNALLASLRYRMEPRLAQAGITLAWQVEPLPPWPGGQAEGRMQSLQFLLFEALSNMLQHAAATRLRLGAAPGDGCIRIVLADNGRGLAPERLPRLAAMRERAAALQARLTTQDAQPGLALTLELSLGP